MPKRATLTFSSDDNQSAAAVDLFVYYCKYSGRHVLTTDCEIDRAPKRRSDEASVIDTEKYQVGNLTYAPLEAVFRRHFEVGIRMRCGPFAA